MSTYFGTELRQPHNPWTTGKNSTDEVGPHARHGKQTAIVALEAALEMPIVTTAKRILTSVRANACRRIAFADTFWGGCDAIVWSDPGQRRRRAKYSRRQHFCIQPQWTESDHMDPNPDYDASDELEYGINWFAWILRGAYPPPAYPPV